MGLNYNKEALAVKILKNELSQSELIESQSIIVSDEDKKLLKDIEKIWTASGKIEFKPNFEKEKAYNSFLQTVNSATHSDKIDSTIVKNLAKPKILSIYRIAMAAAACFAFVLMYNQFFANQNNTFIASSNQNYVMEDGTKIHLEKGSSISWTNTYNDEDRNIILNGKAIFEVTKNPSKPFKVVSGNAEVIVLGTTFLVDGLSNGTTVNVLEGKVSVGNTKNIVTITDRQAAFVPKVGEIQKKEDSNFDQLSWFQSELSFDNTPFSKVISELEAHFGVKLKAEKKQEISNCTFTAKNLKNSDLDRVLKLLEVTFSTTFTKSSDKEYTYSSIKCK